MKIDDSRARYDFRNTYLSALGYRCYKEYLASDDWKTIRNSILCGHTAVCVLCENIAQVVHHLKYDPSVLLGLWNHYLVPLCHKCHNVIEVDGDTKNSHQQANTRFFVALRANRTKSGREWERAHYAAIKSSNKDGSRERNAKMVTAIINENWQELRELWVDRLNKKETP